MATGNTIKRRNRPTGAAASRGSPSADSARTIPEVPEGTPADALRDTVEWLETEIGAAEIQITETSDGAAEPLGSLADRAGQLAAETRNLAGAATRARNDAASAAAAMESLIAQIRSVSEASLPPVDGMADAPGGSPAQLLPLLREMDNATARMRRSAVAIGEVAGATLEVSQNVGGIVASAFYAYDAISKARARIADLRRNLLLSIRPAAGNRRREGRIVVAIDAVLRVGARGFCGRIEDLSVGGALFRSAGVESHGDIAVQALGELGVDGLGNIEATVVSISSAGVHLRFDRIEAQIEERLRTSIAASRRS